MPHSPSEITPQRLDELQGEYSLRYEDRECKCETTDVAACRCCRGLCVCHDDFDTLAALRAYREVLDRLPQLERIDQAARAFVDERPSISGRHTKTWDALMNALYDGRATAPTEAQETCEQCGGRRYLGDVPCSACNAMGESEAQETRSEDGYGGPTVCSCPHCKSPKGSGLLFQHWSKDPAVPYYHCQCATCLPIAPA